MQTEQYKDVMSQVTALMIEQKYNAAINLLIPVRDENPRETEAYIHLGNAYVNIGEIKAGIDEFNKALILEPGNGEILYSIGSAYVLLDDTMSAVEYYNKAEAAGFRSPELYQFLAVTFLEMDDIEQALRNINRAIQLNPFDGKQRLFKTRVFLYAGKLEEALETLDEMNKILPDAFAAYNLRAEIYMEMGRYSEANQICDNARERFPEDPNVAVLKLKALCAAGRYDDALTLIDLMRKTGLYDQAVKQTALQEATAYVGKDQMDKAMEALDEALAKIGEDEDVLFTDLTICSRGKDYATIISLSERLLAVAKREEYIPAGQFFRANAMNDAGRKEDAEKEYKKLLGEFRKITINKPNRVDVYVYRLLCHLKLGEFQKALELGDYLEAFNPESAQPYLLKSMIYKEMGDTENEATQKKKARSIDPNSVDVE